jgi:hypothetical protein
VTLHDLLVLLRMRAGQEEGLQAFIDYEVQASLTTPQQVPPPPLPPCVPATDLQRRAPWRAVAGACYRACC